MAREQSFSARIIDAVESIPEGSVASYGTIAALAGKPRGARAVVWALRSNRRETTPWYRVVNSKGELGAHDGRELQRTLLEAEGIVFDQLGKIDLARFGWPRASTG